MKKKIVYLLLFVEVILLLLGIGNLFRPLMEQNFTYQDFEIIDGKVWDGYGIRTRNLDRIKKEVIKSPSFDIKPGVYELELSYYTDGDENYITVHGANENYNSIRMDDFYLNQGGSKVDTQIWVNKNIRAFQVSGYNDGKSETIYCGMRIKELMTGRIALLLKLLIGLIFFDAVVYLIELGRQGRINREKAFVVSSIILTALFASYPLFNSFITSCDDIAFHLLRIEGIKDGLLAGQFPVRIHPTQYYGYGYASSIFYGEALLYFPAILRLCGFTLQNAYKIFVVTINLATAIIAYRSMKNIFKNQNIALLCMVMYVLAPYRLINIYGRGAVGEYCAMMFWPVIASGLYQLFTMDPKEKEFRKIWITLTIGYTGLIQTHLISCEMAAIFSILLCLINWKKVFRWASIAELMKFFMATLLVNAFFLVPFLSYMAKGGVIVADYGSQQTKAIQGNGMYFAHLFQLFIKCRGMAYGHADEAYKAYGMQNELGTTVGLALLIPLFVFVYCYLMHYERFKKDTYYKTALIAFSCSILTLFMASTLFPWDVLCRNLGNIVANIQFPWRFLSLATIFLTVLLGCMLILARKYTSDHVFRVFLATILLLNIVSCSFLLYDNLVSSKALYTYDGNALAHLGSGSLDEYRPTGTNVDLLKYEDTTTTENVQVDFYYKKYTNIIVHITENEHMDGLVTFPLLAYDGYKAVDENDREIELLRNENGVMTMLVPADFNGNVMISYAGFPSWSIVTWVSIVSIVIFLSILLKNSLKNVDKLVKKVS